MEETFKLTYFHSTVFPFEVSTPSEALKWVPNEWYSILTLTFSKRDYVSDWSVLDNMIGLKILKWANSMMESCSISNNTDSWGFRVLHNIYENADVYESKYAPTELI